MNNVGWLLLLAGCTILFAVTLHTPLLYAQSLASEVPSPLVRLTLSQNAESFIIDKQDLTLYGVADTNSMDPVIDAQSKVLVKNVPLKELVVGDILVFKQQQANSHKLIVHRIVAIGTDSDGWFAQTKGDNSQFVDTELVRAHNVIGTVVAIFY